MMTEFVTIPAIMFIVMVGFIIFLIAFNFYLFYKWGKSLEEIEQFDDTVSFFKRYAPKEGFCDFCGYNYDINMKEAYDEYKKMKQEDELIKYQVENEHYLND